MHGLKARLSRLELLFAPPEPPPPPPPGPEHRPCPLAFAALLADLRAAGCEPAGVLPYPDWTPEEVATFRAAAAAKGVAHLLAEQGPTTTDPKQ
jgi:hypothetical protein